MLSAQTCHNLYVAIFCIFCWSLSYFKVIFKSGYFHTSGIYEIHSAMFRKKFDAVNNVYTQDIFMNMSLKQIAVFIFVF